MKKTKKFLSLVIVMIIFITSTIMVSPTNLVQAYYQGYDGMGPVVISGGKRDFRWPVPNYYNIKSCFYDHRNHCAIDIAAPVNTPAVASYSGTVIEAVDGGTSYYGDDGFGNYVVLQHSYNSANGTIVLYTRYSHLNSVTVKKGATVSAGTTIGKIGTTGSSEGYHLDFQILYGNWKPYQTYSIDPYSNQLLELPSNVSVYDSWDCGKSYYALVKELYSKPVNNPQSTSIIYPTSGSVVKIASGVGNNMYLAFALSNTNVQIFEDGDNNSSLDWIKSQYYKLTHVGDGWYTIVNVGNGKAMDVENANSASGTNIHQYELNKTNAQLFRFYDAGDGYCYIKSKLGCYVDVANGDNVNRTNVWAYSFNGSNAQRWKIIKRNVPSTKLKATSKITATQTTSSITLNWEKVTGATGYRVYVYNSNSKSYKKVKDLKGTSLKISNLKIGTKYKYKVRAYAVKNGTTTWGNYSSAFETATKPATPSLKITSTEKGKATLKWTNVAGESGYVLYTSTKKDSGFKKLKTLDANKTGIRYRGFTSGKTYYFYVRAIINTSSGTVYSGYKIVGIKVK